MGGALGLGTVGRRHECTLTALLSFEKRPKGETSSRAGRTPSEEEELASCTGVAHALRTVTGARWVPHQRVLHE